MATEDERMRLFQEVAQATSRQSAEVLMSYLPPEGWANVATKADLRALGGELHSEISGLRADTAEGFRQVERRFGDMERRFGDMESRFAGVHEQIAGVHEQISGVRQEQGEFYKALAGVHEEMAGLHKTVGGLRTWFVSTLLAFATVIIAAMTITIAVAA